MLKERLKFMKEEGWKFRDNDNKMGYGKGKKD